MNKIDIKNLPYYEQGIFTGDINKIIFCKTNPYNVDKVRFSGGGYHPTRAMALMFKTYKNQDENIKKIHGINMEYAIEKDGALLFPFKFDFAIHSSKSNIIKADWFSGMAQGLALIAYTRVMKDKEMSEKILNSFEHPEILSVEDGYHYMEYPYHCSPLNGHIFALYGLYECWLWQESERALFLLERGIEWIKNNIQYFRNPNGASWYCKEHGVLCDKIGGKYHAVHIRQLNYLYEISGDEWFKEQAKLFYNDFKPDLKHKLTIGNFPFEN